MISSEENRGNAYGRIGLTSLTKRYRGRPPHNMREPAPVSEERKRCATTVTRPTRKDTKTAWRKGSASGTGKPSPRMSRAAQMEGRPRRMVMCDERRKRVVLAMSHSKCPACGYYAFNGVECFDCGYRPRRKRIAMTVLWGKQCQSRKTSGKLWRCLTNMWG